MRRWTFVAAAAALIVAAWWHWPAAAQHAEQPAASGEVITFDQYRDFRARDLQQRQARLAHQLAAPGLAAAEKASLDRRKAYYEKLAALEQKTSRQLVVVTLPSLNGYEISDYGYQLLRNWGIGQKGLKSW